MVVVEERRFSAAFERPIFGGASAPVSVEEPGFSPASNDHSFQEGFSPGGFVYASPG